MKKIKLLLTATKIEYNWFLIKIIRKKRERLTNILSKNADRENELKCVAKIESINYEILSGLRATNN